MKPIILAPSRTTERTDDRSLTENESRLVEIILDGERSCEALSLTEAGLKAGCTGGRESARVSATRALQRPEVQRFLRQRLEAEMLIAAPSAFKALADLSVNGKSEYVRSQAAAAILDRAGIDKNGRKVSISADELIVNIDLS